MPPRSIASATVAFGLVSVPVEVYSSGESAASLSFNMLHKDCGTRLKQQYICPKDEVVVDRESPGAPFVTPARPDNQNQCRFVPLQIRFVQPAATVEVEFAGEGQRRLEVVYRDLEDDISPDNRASDDGRHGGIDFVRIRPLPQDLSNELPAASVRSIKFTTLQRG